MSLSFLFCYSSRKTCGQTVIKALNDDLSRFLAEMQYVALLTCWELMLMLIQ